VFPAFRRTRNLLSVELKHMQLLRFEDLRSKRIVRTWTTINKWIDERGFPPGRMLGRFRVWTEAEVMAWIERQPSDKIPTRGFAKRLPFFGEKSALEPILTEMADWCSADLYLCGGEMSDTLIHYACQHRPQAASLP
jgi:predicted DNA-binding transcriptional regulator AlpA